MPAPVKVKNPSDSFQRFFIRTVTTGLIGILPIGLLIIGLFFVFNLAAKVITPFSGLFGIELDTGSWLGGFVSFAICLFVFFLLGLIIRSPRGGRALGLLERDYLNLLPFYSTIRDSLQAFVGSTKSPFTEVVLVDCYDTCVLMTGFVTDRHPSGIVTVFVPTGPNPANGCIYHVPEEKVTHVDVSIDTALRTIISVGVDSSRLFDHQRPKGDVLEVIVEDV